MKIMKMLWLKCATVILLIHSSKVVSQKIVLEVVEREPCHDDFTVVLRCRINNYNPSAIVYFENPDGWKVSEDCLPYYPSLHNVSCDQANGEFNLTILQSKARDTGHWLCRQQSISDTAYIDTVVIHVPPQLRPFSNNSETAIVCGTEETVIFWTEIKNGNEIDIGSGNMSTDHYTLTRTTTNLSCGVNVFLQYSEIIYLETPCEDFSFQLRAKAYTKGFVEICDGDAPNAVSNEKRIFYECGLSTYDVVMIVEIVTIAILAIPVSMCCCCGLILCPCCTIGCRRYRFKCCDCMTSCTCADPEAIIWCQPEHTQYAEDNKVEPQRNREQTANRKAKSQMELESVQGGFSHKM